MRKLCKPLSLPSRCWERTFRISSKCVPPVLPETLTWELMLLLTSMQRQSRLRGASWSLEGLGPSGLSLGATLYLPGLPPGRTTLWP